MDRWDAAFRGLIGLQKKKPQKQNKRHFRFDDCALCSAIGGEQAIDDQQLLFWHGNT